MALETRTSAHFKRAEQLRRWEDSETNREPVVPKSKSNRVKFSASCVFLAACAAGDKDEVLKLIEKGIDINTATVDGLTALHQACIEDNLDMVEFLVQNGANVNLGDNEGWTPLHAAASCGFFSIAKYLIEFGADVAAINNDGELVIDIAESDDMEDLLQKEVQKRGIDCETARGDEQRRMLKDAKQWASGDPIESIDVPDHKTGATALHIAAAKGYIDVMQILLQNDLVDIDKQDYDGWTPLHAAAHWGQREAAKLLVDNLADMEIKNFYRQTPFDVADPEMLRFLEDLKIKQSSLNKEIILGKRQAKQKTTNAPAKIKKVELQIEKDKEEEENGTIDNNVEKKNRVNAAVTATSPTETNRIFTPSPVSTPSPTTTTPNDQNSIPRVALQTQAPSIPPKAPPNTDNNQDDTGTIPSWRRPASFRTRLGNDSPTKSLALRIGEKDPKSPTSPTNRNSGDSEVVLRRTHSFENDEKFKLRYMELQERIKKASSLYPIPASPDNNPHNHLNNHHNTLNNSTTTQKIITRFGLLPKTESIINPNNNNNNTNNNNINQLTSSSTATDSIDLKLNPLTRSCSLRTDRWLSNNISKDPSNTTTSSSPVSTPTVTISTANTSPNRTSSSPTATSPQPNNNVRRSFVPPVRDEESETQRKAHAKRVRETRRSTQGVTLDEIKSAEQLVKKKNQPTVNNSTDQPSNETSTTTSATSNGDTNGAAIPTVTATITTGTPTVVSRDTDDQQNNILHERRPSWRLRVDNGSKFKLEDVGTNTTGAPTVFVRRTGTTPGQINVRPSSAPIETTNVPPSPPADAVITLPLRRNSKPLEDKEQDKENDVRNAQATQAVIQRRRRPKRRSTGVVHVDMDEIDPDKQDNNAGGDCDDAKLNHQESGSEQGTTNKRLNENNSTALIRDENGEIDYKKLWEQSQIENDRLREKLRKQDDELRDTKTTLEKISTVTSKNSLSELEKREKRAMERKLSEMEEELKQFEALKVEIQRLKDENGALIRVISKLSK